MYSIVLGGVSILFGGSLSSGRGIHFLLGGGGETGSLVSISFGGGGYYAFRRGVHFIWG